MPTWRNKTVQGAGELCGLRGLPVEYSEASSAIHTSGPPAWKVASLHRREPTVISHLVTCKVTLQVLSPGPSMPSRVSSMCLRPYIQFLSLHCAGQGDVVEMGAKLLASRATWPLPLADSEVDAFRRSPRSVYRSRPSSGLSYFTMLKTLSAGQMGSVSQR